MNTARGAICDKDAVAAAVKSGQLNGYAGDVWNVQPAPADHVWRTMKNPLGGGNGMVQGPDKLIKATIAADASGA